MSPIRILAGLPPYGPFPEQFSHTGQGTHRVGLVVEFTTDLGTSWVGNFQRGGTRFDSVPEVPGSGRPLVIAGGAAYVIDAGSRQCLRMFGSDIAGAWRVSADKLILSKGLWLEAVGKDCQTLWRTRRLSWDGFSEVTVSAERVTGRAYNPVEDSADPFSVDLATGEATGGSYPPELEG